MPARTFSPKTCPQCKEEFTPTGSAQTFCSVDCRNAAAGAEPATKPKKKKPIKTGFRSESPARRDPPPSGHLAGAIAGAIAGLEAELASIDERRASIDAALTTLSGLAEG